MPITPQQIATAKQIQDTAAQDTNQAVRLVAGPGTGKSFVIEGRVHWLLSNQNIPAQNIIAVSFTRAASKDLKDRIHKYCLANNQNNGIDVQVSTLHSLALSILRRTGNLTLFPTDPCIMNDWELSEVFDSEYGLTTNLAPSRCSDIRREHEAFWSTGTFNPPNIPVLPIPITTSERASFTGYYYPRMQAYSCVLPGEIIRMCVTQINAGLINPVSVLGVQHLIVDEVQDLNPCDFEFIDLLFNKGVNVFICGDDDQSVYSFRYAFPKGIQDFNAKYPLSTIHILVDCFRCTPAVLNAAINVINNYPAPNRIPKNLVSLYSNSNPVNNGFVQANIFNTHILEASYIANSCHALIAAGISPKDIMILVGNKRIQLKPLKDAFDNLGLGYDANEREEFIDHNYGRFLICLLRIIENPDDYIAHRVILGTPSGIGIKTCCKVTDKVISNNLNYKNIFYNPLPTGVFATREISAIDKAKTNILSIQGWSLSDTINQKMNEIEQILLSNFSSSAVNEWRTFISNLPVDMTLDELKDYMQTDSQETKDRIVNTVYSRLNMTGSQATPRPDIIKIMSFHSSKGLSAKVVFIPGLDEGVFPNIFAQQIPGLILEQARLFYVGITRAKAACIFSHASSRIINGLWKQMAPSRYCSSIGVRFNQQNNPSLNTTEIQSIVTCIRNL